MGIDQATIDEILRRILSISNADRIILYGSAATGKMTPDSDIDLLVLEQNPDNSSEKRVEIGDVLRGLGYAFDVRVMATERFEETKDVIGGIAYPADKYGAVIYDVTTALKVRKTVLGALPQV